MCLGGVSVSLVRSAPSHHPSVSSGSGLASSALKNHCSELKTVQTWMPLSVSTHPDCNNNNKQPLTYCIAFIATFPLLNKSDIICKRVQEYLISSSLQFSSALLRWIRPWSSSLFPQRFSTRSREPPESIFASASQSAASNEHPHKLHMVTTYFSKYSSKSKHQEWCNPVY